MARYRYGKGPGRGAPKGRLVEAAQLVGFLDALYVRQGRVIDPGQLPLYSRLMEMLRAGLPAAELDAWRGIGADWSEEEAIEFVVNRLADAPASGEAGASASSRDQH